MIFLLPAGLDPRIQIMGTRNRNLKLLAAPSGEGRSGGDGVADWFVFEIRAGRHIRHSRSIAQVVSRFHVKADVSYPSILSGKDRRTWK